MDHPGTHRRRQRRRQPDPAGMAGVFKIAGIAAAATVPFVCILVHFSTKKTDGQKPEKTRRQRKHGPKKPGKKAEKVPAVKSSAEFVFMDKTGAKNEPP